MDSAVATLEAKNAGASQAAALLKAAATLRKLLANLAKDPTNDKFRRVRTSNAVIKAKVVSVPGALGVLEAAGFRPDAAEPEDVLVIPDAAGDGTVFRKGLALLTALETRVATTLTPTLRLSAALGGHSSDVKAVAILPDNDDKTGTVTVATGCNDNLARTFDAKTGAPGRVFRGHAKPERSDPGVLGVALFRKPQSPAEVLLASCARDGLVMLWDERAGTPIEGRAGHGEPLGVGLALPSNAQVVACCCVVDRTAAGGGVYLATGGWDTTIIVWDALGDEPARRFGPCGKALNGICRVTTQDGDDWVVAADGDGCLYACQPFSSTTSSSSSSSTGVPVRGVDRVMNDCAGTPLRAIAAPATGGSPGTFATASNDGVLRWWDLGAQPSPLVRGAVASAEYLYAVSADKDRVACAGEDGVVSLFRAPALTLLSRFPLPGVVWCVALRGDDLVAGCEGTLGAYALTTDAARPDPPKLVADNVTNISGAAKATIIKAAGSAPVLEGEAARPSAAARGGAASGPGLASNAGDFDFSFPVEMEGQPKMTIEWNRGDDLDQVALEFCLRNRLPQAHTPEILNFMRSAMGQHQQQPAPGGSAAGGAPSAAAQAEMVSQVMALGVDEARARDALQRANWTSVDAAANLLFG